MKPYDLVILGGGTAGLVAAVGAASFGGRVVMVEKAPAPGGDCLWTGCVPSKALLASAKVAHTARTAADLGVAVGGVSVDFAAVMQRVKDTQEVIAHHDSVERLEGLGIEVIRGEGRFVDERTVEVDGRRLRFRKGLIATGARPALPPIDGLAEADPLTSDTVWELERLPRRLTVLGGGAIGVELGQAFARLGSDVTVVEMLDRLLPHEEPEASTVIEARLRAEGITVLTGTRALSVETRPSGGGVLAVEGPAGRSEVDHTHLLVATGRTPNSRGIGLEELGVEFTDRGHVVVDETMRTNVSTLFAAGDVTTRPPFTHVAGMDGSVVMSNALFGLRRKRQERVLWSTFCDPEVGRVGMSEAQAREEHGDATVQVYDHEDLDRGITESRTDGFTKLVGDHKGRIVGATVVGPHAGEAIAAVDAWIRAGAKIGDVGQAMHAYPTYAEGIQQAGVQQLRSMLTPRTRAVIKPVLGAARLADRLLRS